MRKVILFRISSKGYPKVKVDKLNKFDCLNNLFQTFPDWEFVCVADNCDGALLARLKAEYSFTAFFETKLGNPGSFWFLYEYGLHLDDSDIIYFIEDDYLHFKDAPQAIQEGLQHFEYVTLYDHPDKYRLEGKPTNPYAKRNKFSENTEVFHQDTFIWRTTNSTTMSFAILGKTLKEDQDIWSVTKQGRGDFDFEIFATLTKQPILWRKRYLKHCISKIKYFSKPRRYMGVCVPGCALHLELAYISNKDIDRFLIPT